MAGTDSENIKIINNVYNSQKKFEPLKLTEMVILDLEKFEVSSL